ncbi:MAG: ABC transporter permease [archaeon]|jgi:ABC-type multidrug transport system permease subunit
MKLYAIIKKEIMAVKSQKISILLILLYPLLGTLLLGLAMTGSNFDTASNIYVGITSNNSTLFSELSTSATNYNFVEYNDIDYLKEAVRKKQVTVGLEFNEVQGEQTKVNIYYDNSNVQSSGIFTSMVKTTIENIAKEQTLKSISEIIKTTNLLSTNMNDELDKLKDLKTTLHSADTMLNNLEIKINSFDINDLRKDIGEQKENIDTFKEKNAKLKEILVSARTEFNSLKTVVNQLNFTIANYSAQLKQLEIEIIIQESNLDSIIDQLNNIYPSIPQSIQATYSAQLTQLSNLSAYLAQWKNTIINVNDLIDSTSNSQSSMNSKINEFETFLSDLENESAQIDTALISSEQGIAKLESKIGLFESTLVQAKELIAQSRTSKITIEDNINKSEILFKELLPKIDSFKDMNPALVIQPIEITLIPTQVNSKSKYSLINMDPTQLGVMVASSISIILILTCILLTGIVILTEKNQDIPLRTFMSGVNPLMLTSGKLIGQIVIALVETIVILIVAMSIFGFALSNNWIGLFLSIILIASAFISIGLVIGAYTKNQSTTILLSLLLIVPMLFVSGIIVPLDLMPSFISIFASVLPLTAANNLLIGVIVKAGDIYFIWKEIIVLLTITIIGIVLYTLKKE